METIDKVNKLNKSDFLSIFGNVFEKNEWIAEKTFDFGPFKNFEELFFKMIEIFEKSQKVSHLKILNSHPELVVEKKSYMNSIDRLNKLSKSDFISISTVVPECFSVH